jgi:hypothetical protein
MEVKKKNKEPAVAPEDARGTSAPAEPPATAPAPAKAAPTKAAAARAARTRMRVALFFLAFLFIPISAGLARALAAVEREAGGGELLGMSAGLGMFLFGLMFFLLFFTAFRPSPKPYVAGHELTHAMFAWLSGGRARNMRFVKNGGRIELSKCNVFILLSPYFLPFYVFLLLLLLAPVSTAVSLAAGADGEAANFFRGARALAAGTAWGFHACWTANALLQRQSDLEEYGFFFSFHLVLAFNLLALCVVFWAISPTSAARFASTAWGETSATIMFIIDFIGKLAW